MKKVLMAVFALALATSVATAGVGIGWTTQWGGYDHTVTPPLTGGTGAILDADSVIWQLIYAGANNVADPVSITGDYTSGDDAVWAQRSIAMGGGTAPEDGTSWDNWMLETGGTVVYEDLAWTTAGFSFQRVFEGTPADQSWYMETPLLALDTGYVGGGAPTQASIIGDLNGGFQPDQQIDVIPEPATMGLLGLGALVMAIRRRRS